MFVLGAIVSLCYVPGVTGAFIATQWPLLSILLPCMLWRRGAVTVVHWAGLAFLAYAAVRLWYAPIIADGVFGLWLVCIMGLSFWLGSTLKNLRSLYAGLAIGASVSSVVAVFQYFGYAVLPSIGAPAGLYVNGVASGAIGCLLVIALVSERMWLWVPLLIPGIVLSGSRGAWIALAIGLASMYVRGIWILLALGTATTFFLTYPLAPSDALRMSIWSSAVDQLTWLGWGPGAFSSWLLYRDGSTFYPEYAHNDALQLAFEYGLAAILPISVFAFVLRRTAEREWPVIVAFAVLGCYSMPLWMPIASFLACVAAGRVVGGWGMVRARSRRRRLYVLSQRERDGDYASFATVSVVPHS